MKNSFFHFIKRNISLLFLSFFSLVSILALIMPGLSEQGNMGLYICNNETNDIQTVHLYCFNNATLNVNNETIQASYYSKCNGTTTSIYLIFSSTVRQLNVQNNSTLIDISKENTSYIKK